MNFISLSKDLQKLNNHDLLARARELAQEERRAGIALLHHLREIERRKLFAANHGSLHEYVVRELGYSDGAAHRRISAMRLMSTLPEIEDRLHSGALTLSTASQVQNFLRTEKKLTGNSPSVTEVRQLVSKVEGKSTRETESLLAARAPQVAQHLAARRLERPSAIGADSVQVSLVIGCELQEKLHRLRDRTAHRDPNPSLAQQIEWLADFALARLGGEPHIHGSRNPSAGAEAGARSPNSGAEAQTLSTRSGAEARKHSSPPPQKTQSKTIPPSSRTRRYVAAPLRREIWRRAGAQCEMHLASGLRCSRTHLLQIDHIVPSAWGGTSTAKNLQLLCAIHNGLKSDRLPGE
jgi:5-methylcytosine-specific restriction endonuclease McrA